MTFWYFIDTGENTGRFNMDFDLELVERVATNNIPILRFYRWKPYAISLGHNQNINSINFIKCEENKIDVVRRPTGGRAILHAEELTYSVTFPLEKFSPQEMYQLINKALVEGLHEYHPALRRIELEKNQIDFKTFYKSARSIPCFSSSARSEIKFLNRKLIGSAQRVIGNVLLQHGSILCGEFHKKIVDFLNLSDEEKMILSQDLNEKTISLSEILKEKLDYDRLKDSLRKGFQKIFDVELVYFEMERIR